LVPPDFVSEEITEADFRLSKAQITTIGKLKTASEKQLQDLHVPKFVIAKVLATLK